MDLREISIGTEISIKFYTKTRTQAILVYRPTALYATGMFFFDKPNINIHILSVKTNTIMITRQS